MYNWTFSAQNCGYYFVYRLYVNLDLVWCLYPEDVQAIIDKENEEMKKHIGRTYCISAENLSYYLIGVANGTLKCKGKIPIPKNEWNELANQMSKHFSKHFNVV